MNNRELKFRVWLHDTKKWGNVACIEVFNSTGKLEYLYQDQPYTIQQYTGLKDKNGVEIYEGDILMPDTIDGIWPEQRNGVMVKDIRQPFANAHLFKIVGNIFETPELIKTNE